MSTANWPSAWGKNHEAICFFFGIFTRPGSDGKVELWRLAEGKTEQRCIGTVPVEITHQALSVAAKAMIESYDRGFSDGQSSLAAAVLAPINAALQSNS